MVVLKFILSNLNIILIIFLCYVNKITLEVVREPKYEKKKCAVNPGTVAAFHNIPHSHEFLMNVYEFIFLIIH